MRTVARKKNVDGFVDGHGFHPIRSSEDYDDVRAGEHKPFTSRPTRVSKAAAKRLGISSTATQGRLFNPSIAQTILHQLGGNKFAAMTGAKTFANTGNGLRFRLPANFATGGINLVTITLNGRDLYDVEFGKLRGSKYSAVKIDKNIYADMLRDLFTQRTGLDVSLGTMKNPRAKKNPDLLGMFANAAVGIASTLQIHEMTKTRKRKAAPKKRGTTKAKARKRTNPTPLRKPAARKAVSRTNPRSASGTSKSKGDLYVLTIGSGDDLISVYLHDGKHDGFSKRFKTMTAAKSYATRNKVKLVENPGIVSRAWARSRAAAEYRKELRLEAAAERSRARRRKAEAKAKANPTKRKTKSVKRKTVRAASGKKAVTRSVTRKASASVKRPRAAASRKNPKTTARRRTFEMFQGRKATTARPMSVSRHAPKRLDQLGDLVAIKLIGQPEIRFNGKSAKLCAAGGKLWIAGKRFAKPNPAAPANEINPIGEIDHVVYGTYKPHHGDHNYTHYIHKLGEESGKVPVLCVDREGYPVIRGGNYKIEARGIVD